ILLSIFSYVSRENIFIVNLTAFIFGIVIGFTGPNLELFKSDNSPLPSGKITIEEESWISSLAAFGAIGFTLFYGFISEKCGRKIAILLIGIPQTTSWIIMAFASSVNHIYISRLLSGVAGAGWFFVVPVYIAEIADKTIRGGLCASFSVICNTGIFLEFILAEYMDFRDAAILIGIVSLVFVIGFTFMPESPQYLISRKRYDEAEISFKFFRGLQANEQLPQHLQEDFDSIKEIGKDDGEEKQIRDLFKHIVKPGVMKTVFLACVVCNFPLLSGCFVLITYNQGIFKAADVGVLSVFWSSLAFAFIQIVASVFTAKFVDRVGRRKILISSSLSSAFCLAVFATYMYIKTETNVDLTSLSWVKWIPVISLLVEVFVSSIGIIPVPNFYGPEILDQKRTSRRNQYICAFFVNTIAVSHGCVVGWLSPFIPYLQSSQSHLTTGPVTSNDVSWIGSLMPLGGFIGTTVFGTITERLGKRISLFMLLVPHLSFWCLIYFSTNVSHLYIARILGGITGGGSMRILPLYITEISENKIRGTLGSFYVLSLSLGTFLMFVMGTYFNFFIVPLIILIFPSIFFISLFFLHDTPTSLISRKKFDEAFIALKFYRTCGKEKQENVHEEFELLRKALQKEDDKKWTVEDFASKSAQKSFLLGLFLIFLNQFSGTFAIMTYTAEIFRASGSSLKPNESSMIIGFIQLVGVYVSTICVDRFGRKILMSISCFGTSIFLFILGSYSYLNASGFDISNLSWIPILSLSLVIFLASLGVISLPFIMITELMPSNVKRFIHVTIAIAIFLSRSFIFMVVNIITLSHGCIVGWLSPFIPYLRSSESHLTSGSVNSNDISWIGSSLSIGGLVGTIVFGRIAQKFGTKKALILLAFPHIIFWLLVFFSTNVYHLYLARGFAGLSGGGIIRNISLYVTEISENKIRGKLGSYMVLWFSAGILLIFVIGTHLSFFVVPLVLVLLPISYFFGILYFPDTPTSLITFKKSEEAWNSLLFFRTYGKHSTATASVVEEFNLLKTTLEKKDYEKVELDDFMTKPAKKALVIAMFLMFLNQFSGTFAVMTYTADIFKHSGSDISANNSSTVVAVLQLIGVYLSTIFVERCGRKILMTISCTGASLFLLILGTYFYIKTSFDEMNQYSWIPVVSLSLYIFHASFGIISLPFVITTELLPNKVRKAACTICMSAITVLAFIVLKIYPPSVKLIGIYGCMWFFSAICLLGAIVTIIFIPETKGISLITSDEESQKMLPKPKEKNAVVKAQQL
ncbi:CLUMA_CG017935, isoform A, partial [Clunio marinus]